MRGYVCLAWEELIGETEAGAGDENHREEALLQDPEANIFVCFIWVFVCLILFLFFLASLAVQPKLI